jgi:sugar lactone lactonase YvrE
LRSVFKLSGGTLTRVVGTGVEGGIASDGRAIDSSLSSPEGVAVDSAGNVYIADAGGILQVAPDGAITSLFVRSYGVCGQGLVRPSGLAVDSAGNVYVGDEDTSQLLLITPTGFGTCLSYLSQPEGVAVDASGNLYVAAPYEQKVWKVSSTIGGGESVFAGSGKQGYSGDGGPATKASLNTPYGVAVDESGNVYIADTYNYRIRKVAPDGVITTVAGTGTQGYSGDGGPAIDAKISAPYGLASDSTGNLYFADNNVALVRRISASGTITTVAGGHMIGDGGAATSAELNLPRGVAKDAAGNLYVAEFDGNRIRKVGLNGKISTFAGNGTAGFSGDGEPAEKAELDNPIDVAVDAAGELYIADWNYGRVRKVGANGTITTIAGSGFHGNLSDGIMATAAELSTIGGIALDKLGNLYISDQGLSSDLPAPMPRVRKVARDGTITTVAGNGKQGYSGDGGEATKAQLDMPSGLAVDASGNLYIADYNNFRIRKVTPGGLISTVAGNGQQGSLGDGGPATAAELDGASAVTVDASGDLFIADYCAIRRVKKGIITTVAGGSGCDYSGAVGPATKVGLQPLNLVVDSAGRIYAADYSSHTVVVLTPAVGTGN